MTLRLWRYPPPSWRLVPPGRAAREPGARGRSGGLETVCGLAMGRVGVASGVALYYNKNGDDECVENPIILI